MLCCDRCRPPRHKRASFLDGTKGVWSRISCLPLSATPARMAATTSAASVRNAAGSFRHFALPFRRWHSHRYFIDMLWLILLFAAMAYLISRSTTYAGRFPGRKKDGHGLILIELSFWGYWRASAMIMAIFILIGLFPKSIWRDFQG